VQTAAREASAALNVGGEDEQIAFLLGPSARRTAAPAGGLYKPGDTGPAGGIVFFDKGTAESGWRYLEAAPRDIGPSHWGAYGFSLDTGAHTGSGKRNTQNILSALRRYAGNSYAAQLCEALEINGYADWFLPGIDELNLMYTNLKKKGLGGFTADWYWSSSQKNSLNAWGQGFGDGSRAAYGKNYPSRVRAVRAF
jgi:hypothetical protein